MKPKSIGAVLLIMFLMVACGQQGRDGIAEVGVDFDLAISPEVITDFLYVNMDYTFNVTSDFQGFSKDYMVFVHFWRLKNKEMLVQDDHSPVVNTSEWEPGDTIHYSREFFIPKFLDELDIDFEGYEEVRLQIGLYDSGNPEDKMILYEQVLNVQPASINAPDIIYTEGWNEEEMNLALDNSLERIWRWTTARAVCVMENPGKKSVLIVKGASHPAIFEDQTIRFLINDTLLDEFSPETLKFEKKYTLTPEMMGDKLDFRFIIETDKTVVPSELDPANRDSRELGVQIFLLYLRET